jgi:hypothetical protein
MTKVSKINVHYADEQIKSYADTVRLSATENIRKYLFKSRQKNPDWSVEKLISLRSCHILNNAEKLKPEYFISETPKWLTVLEKPIAVDTGSGEIVYEDYQTDDFKASRNRKIKTVERFCDYYEPLYQNRKVSLLFHTFTRMDFAKEDMRRMLDNVKYRYELINRPVRGYLWALELKANENMDGGYHIHYHLVVAVDRIKVKEIPEALKFEDLWGQRTGVEFITKSIRRYLSKYLYKSEAKLLGKRSYSISRKLL